MRSVIQGVGCASVTVSGETIGQIKTGLLVLLAVHINDTEKSITKMADKIINLRIFQDDNGKMNKSVLDINGEILVVSQFTLYGDCSKGNRPSFIEAAPPDKAKKYYEELIRILNEKNIKVQTGQFQTHMKIDLTNDGPTTIIIET